LPTADRACALRLTGTVRSDSAAATNGLSVVLGWIEEVRQKVK